MYLFGDTSFVVIRLLGYKKLPFLWIWILEDYSPSVYERSACRWSEGNPLFISISILKWERKVIVMKNLVRVTWLVDDVFGDSFVRLWQGEVMAAPTLDEPFLEGDLSLLSLIGVEHAETGDWGWVDLEPQTVEKLSFRYVIVSSLAKGITSGIVGQQAWAIETYEYAKKNQPHLKKQVHTEFFSKGFIRHQLLPEVNSGKVEGSLIFRYKKHKNWLKTYVDWQIVISDIVEPVHKEEELEIPSIVLKYRGNNFKNINEDFPLTPEMIQACRDRFKEKRIDKNGKKELTYKQDRFAFCIDELYGSILERLNSGNEIYVGKKVTFTKKDFYRYAIKHEDFKICYRLWIANNFQQKWTPTVDRIDRDGDYSFDNIRFIPYHENSIDGALEGVALIGEKEGTSVYFWTQKMASELLEIPYNKMLEVVKNGEELNGWTFSFIPKIQLFKSFVTTLVIPEQHWNTSYIKIFRFKKNVGFMKIYRLNNPNVDFIAYSLFSFDVRVFLF